MTVITAIVFGANGDVGSVVALKARQLGMRVVLATRSLKTPISNPNIKNERITDFTRVEADLTQPQSVYNAVLKAKATRAFIYMVSDTSDYMRSSIQALKSAGIEFVIVLSSHSIQKDIRSIPQDSFIPWSNAQVEIALEEIMGPRGFIALRPGYFASNVLWWKPMIRDGVVKTVYPDLGFDWVSPKDIGNVGGMLLTKPMALLGSNGPNYVYLCGPELLSQRDVLQAVSKALAIDIKVVPITKEECLQVMRASGEREEVIRSSLGMMTSRYQGGDDPSYSAPFYEDVKGNIEKYSLTQASTFLDWLEENKARFLT